VVRGRPRSSAMSPFESAYDFLFDFNRNYASILYRFRNTASYLSKFANFDLRWLTADVTEWAARTRRRWWLPAQRPRRWSCRCETTSRRADWSRTWTDGRWTPAVYRTRMSDTLEWTPVTISFGGRPAGSAMPLPASYDNVIRRMRLKILWLMLQLGRSHCTVQLFIPVL